MKLIAGCPRFPNECLFIVVGCLLAVLLHAPTACAQVSADSLYKDAGEAYDSGDLERAISLYEKLIELQPESFEARTDFGVALAHAGRYDDAIAQYVEALKYDRQNPVVRLNLALAWYKKSDFLKAADELAQLRNDHPEGQQSLYLLADCYLRLGKNREAIALLQPAYKANPDDRAMEYALGTALIREGQLDEGEIFIARILKAGDSAEVNLLMGAAQMASGDPKKAAATIRKALNMDSNLPGGWSLYGQALQECGEHETAKSAFENALRADSNDFDANLRLGILLRRDGSSAEAGPYLERALRLRPSSIPARYQVGLLNTALGNLQLARKHFEQVARDSPDFQQVHVQLAALYARLGLTSDSQREREIVLKLNEKARELGPQPEQ